MRAVGGPDNDPSPVPTFDVSLVRDGEAEGPAARSPNDDDGSDPGDVLAAADGGRRAGLAGRAPARSQLRRQQNQQQQQQRTPASQAESEPGASVAAAAAALGHDGTPPAAGSPADRKPLSISMGATAAQPPPLAGSAITCLTPWLPPAPGLPPLQPGEWRCCGLTFHPDVAPAARQAMEGWIDARGGPSKLADMQPDQVQVRIPQHVQDCTAFKALRLSWPNVQYKVAKLLGLVDDEDGADGGGTGAAASEPAANDMPAEAPWLSCLLQPCHDQARGAGLAAATQRLRKNTVLGVCGGYVMPGAAFHQLRLKGHLACGFKSWRPCRAVDAKPSWQLLVDSFRAQHPGVSVAHPQDASGTCACTAPQSQHAACATLAIV